MNDDPMVPRVGMRREPCAVCGMPVFLAEKLVVSRTPYHRTCFRCARCGNQLTPGNYYETEEGQYCCETCPDEEATSPSSSSSPSNLHQAYNDSVILGHEDLSNHELLNQTSSYQRSLSDEEKTERRAQLTEEIFDRPRSEKKNRPDENPPVENISQTAQMRLSFMASQMLSEGPEEESKTAKKEAKSSSGAEEIKKRDSSPPGGDFAKRRSPEGAPAERIGDAGRVETARPSGIAKDRRGILRQEFRAVDIGRSSRSVFRELNDDDEDRKLEDSSGDAERNEGEKRRRRSFDAEVNEVTRRNEDFYSHLDDKDASVRQDTKDKLGLVADREDEEECLSLVQRRLRMFEKTETTDGRRVENSVTSPRAAGGEFVDGKIVGEEIREEKKIGDGIREERKIEDGFREERNIGDGIREEKKIVDGIREERKIVDAIREERKIVDGIREERKKIDGIREERKNVHDIREERKIADEIRDDGKIVDEIPEARKIVENDETEPKLEISSESEDVKLKDEIVSSRTEEEEEEEEEESNVIEDNSIDDAKLPPVVPKRVGLEARRAARTRAKNAEVTVLNAPGIDLSGEEIYPEDLNPFKSDEEEEVEGNLETSRSSRVSTNPFGSSDEDEEERPKVVATPKPATRSNIAGKKSPKDIREDVDEAPTKRLLKAPQIHLNPFWSDDDEEPDSEDDCGIHSLPADTPVPKPRTIRQTPQRRTEFERGDIYASNSSLGSTGSTSTPGGTYRKKKPAPPPPIAKELFVPGAESPLSPSRRTYTGSNNSLHSTPRARKAKPAPPPPMPLPTSTPYSASPVANIAPTESPIVDSGKIIEGEDYKTWEDPKLGKDEANRNTRSMSAISCDEANVYGGYADKSVQGKWKRKKGPAPARPIPHRRKIKVMSLKDVKLELDEIEMQQQGLEKQGVRLEQLIRDKAETGIAAEETSLGIDVEELVLELFVLVNEKNELFRRQAELMLLRRQQRLEEEHADIEYQIRCLLCQPEATKTDFDKQREETLIQRLVEIVERRNEIVECLEMDRRREVEEDRSINTQMGLYAAKNKGDSTTELEDEAKNRARKSRKSRLKEKAKEKILRKSHKKDADKDVDESEVKLKRQNKKKWF